MYMNQFPPHMQSFVPRPQYYQFPQHMMPPQRAVSQQLPRMQSIPQPISQPKPQQVSAPNPFQRGPASMDVDSSLQSKMVNYVNRPRNYHIEYDDSEEYFKQLPYLANVEYPETPLFERYCENIEYQQPHDEQYI